MKAPAIPTLLSAPCASSGIALYWMRIADLLHSRESRSLNVLGVLWGTGGHASKRRAPCSAPEGQLAGPGNQAAALLHCCCGEFANHAEEPSQNECYNPDANSTPYCQAHQAANPPAGGTQPSIRHWWRRRTGLMAAGAG